MKLTQLILTCLALTASMVAAPAVEAPNNWITPQAQAIRDRVNAARAAIEGWTATTVSESVTMANGGTRTPGAQITERYLRSEGQAGYYASIQGTAQDPAAIVQCQDLAVQRLVGRGRSGASNGHVAPASEFNRPDSWLKFDLAFAKMGYVRWAGKEIFAGQNYDIVEAIDLQRSASDDQQSVTGIFSIRFYVNPAGLIERIIFATDKKSDAQAVWSEQRITYDAKAKLTPEDFSQARFERDAAAVVLQGRPMPELEVKSFAVGGTLPDFIFTGWSDGKPFRLSELKGKVVVVETWTSWCHYCKEAFPTYERMRQALAAQDVVFVAVSFDEKLANYEKWMKQHAGDYGFKFGRVDAADPKQALKEFKGSLPAFYVLGRDGKIVSAYLGWGYGRGEEDPRLLEALRKAGVKL